VLEESTDSDVTIYSYEEDKGGNESDSDEDGQLDENSETNKKGGTRTHLNWTNILNFKEIRKYENLSGPKHSLTVGSSEKDFFALFAISSTFENQDTFKNNSEKHGK
jgi:hypothetical protein